MGIRFRCHYCEYELHVKDFQAGKRGKCPECSGKFRIPLQDSQHSLPLESVTADQDNSSSVESLTASTSADQPMLMRSRTTGSSTSISLATEALPKPNVEPVGDGLGESATTFASLDAIREEPGAVWYVRPPSGGQYGPAAGKLLGQWVIESRVTRDSLVWRDGWPGWKVAADVFSDFFGSATAIDEQLAGHSEPETAMGLNTDRNPSPTTPLFERSRQLKRKKRKSKYALAIGLLAFVAIALLVTLIVVLTTQQAGTTQTTP